MIKGLIKTGALLSVIGAFSTMPYLLIKTADFQQKLSEIPVMQSNSFADISHVQEYGKGIDYSEGVFCKISGELSDVNKNKNYISLKGDDGISYNFFTRIMANNEFLREYKIGSSINAYVCISDPIFDTAKTYDNEILRISAYGKDFDFVKIWDKSIDDMFD